MSAAAYTVRYRSALHPDSVRLIVEDATGKHHLFTCRPDHCSLHPLPAEDLHATNLARLGWHPIAESAALSLDALRSLMTGALFTHHLPPALEPSAPGQS